MSVASHLPDALVDRYREAGFVAVLSVGALVLSLGLAFLIIGATVGTGPPAPYMTPSNKYALVGLSLAACAVGLILIRAAGRIVGW